MQQIKIVQLRWRDQAFKSKIEEAPNLFYPSDITCEFISEATFQPNSWIEELRR